MDDPELINILVRAVEESMKQYGQPLEGTRLGHVLGDAYRERKTTHGARNLQVHHGGSNSNWSTQEGLLAPRLGQSRSGSGWKRHPNPLV